MQKNIVIFTALVACTAVSPLSARKKVFHQAHDIITQIQEEVGKGLSRIKENVKSIGKNFKLHSAAHNWQHDRMRTLLKRHANPNAPDVWGRTPLHISLAEGDLIGSRILLEHKADCTIADHNGNNALIAVLVDEETRQIASKEMIELWAKHCDLADDQNHALHLAATLLDGEQQLEIAKALLMYGAPVNSQDDCGNTLLHQCVLSEEPSTNLAHLLINYRADKEVKNFLGATPLMLAMKEKRSDIAEFLIENGADINANLDGNTPLHYAVRADNREVAAKLLTYGAKQMADDEGQTPLEIACQMGLIEIADLLIAHGADIKECAKLPILKQISAAKEKVNEHREYCDALGLDKEECFMASLVLAHESNCDAKQNIMNDHTTVTTSENKDTSDTAKINQS